MSLIKTGIVLLIFAAAADATYFDGVVAWVSCAVLALAAVGLFCLGCQISARRAAKHGEAKGAERAIIRLRDRALSDLGASDPDLPGAHLPPQ